MRGASAETRRRVDRERVSGRSGEAAGDEEDEIDELRAVGGGAPSVEARRHGTRPAPPWSSE